VLIEHTFLTTSSIVILSAPATRRSYRQNLRTPTIISAASAGTTFRPTRTHTALRDMTLPVCRDLSEQTRVSGFHPACD
jgi:hypothetical protein